jgi:hypothetical protein
MKILMMETVWETETKVRAECEMDMKGIGCEFSFGSQYGP